jgi:hypothetical protein
MAQKARNTGGRIQANGGVEPLTSSARNGARTTRESAFSRSENARVGPPEGYRIRSSANEPTIRARFVARHSTQSRVWTSPNPRTERNVRSRS